MRHNSQQPALKVAPQKQAIRRALVVDDSPFQRRVLSALLKRNTVEVQDAASGDEAIEICKSFHPDLVISDWMMPGMNGLEFCRRFRAMERNSYGYFILLTAKSDKDEIARGLDAGADDFLTKPVNTQELRARINAGERILQMEQKLNSQNLMISETLSELQKLYDAIDDDLRQARAIQQSLVPQRSSEQDGSRVSLLLEPCGHVGGDLVGVFSPGANRLGFYNIDVSGHGITSAMVTARVAGYLSNDFPEQNIALESRYGRFFAMRPPQEIADRLNQRLSADHGTNEYLTMALATADLRTGLVKIVQAGHPPPLLIRRNGTMSFIGTGGLPIGLIANADYDQIEVTLSPGDRLLLYSDGFTECMTKNGTFLDDKGLAHLVREIGPDIVGTEFLDNLYLRLCEIQKPDSDFEDDISAALLEYQVA